MNRILEESTRDANPVIHVHAWKSPAGETADVMNLYAHHAVYQTIMEQAEAALPNETGGFPVSYTHLTLPTNREV